MTTFADLGISKEVIKAMDEMGWTVPTPVQVAAIPVGLAGHDLFAQAQTGTGKTGTYASIILGKIRAGSKAPAVLILTPTRELTIQVTEEMEKISKYTGHSSVSIYGGVSLSPQISKLEHGVDIVVGTPGRVKDLIIRRDLNSSKITMVVLDEADRMLDMGFSKDLEFILSKISKQRQTLMFSATMSPDIKRLAVRHMINPEELLVSKDKPVLDLIKQYYIITNVDSKRDALCTILDNNNPRTIVFCHTKRKVNQLTKKMLADGYIAGALHGDVAQNKREKIINAFKDGSLNLLIATDVAARGLDIDDVTYVINYDMPNDPETYVHRIGRVGRAGKEGIAVSFIMHEERNMIKPIEKQTGMTLEILDLEIIERPDPIIIRPLPPKKFAPAEKRGPKAPYGKAAGTAKTTAKVSGKSYNNSDFKKKKDPDAPASMEINLGCSDKITKGELCNFIVNSTGIPSRDIGSIIMGEKSAFVELRRKDGDNVAADLSDYEYKGKEIKARLI